MDELKALRIDYDRNKLERSDLDSSPISFFSKWLKEAIDSEELEPSAMNLSTVNALGHPSSRIVLLKGLSEAGLEFYTNYGSRKSSEIQDNAQIAINFFWATLHRQVRITGSARRMGVEASTKYFQSRPKNSQIGAWASSQSEVMMNDQDLINRYEEIALQYKDAAVLPLPPFWGGFIVEPDSYEFWQGRPSRLHDRFRYLKYEDGWKIDRLWP